VKAVTHIAAGKQAAVAKQEGLICRANHNCRESKRLTEIKVASGATRYPAGICQATPKESPMPLEQTIFLATTIGAFCLFGATLAFCRAVSKDLPR